MATFWTDIAKIIPNIETSYALLAFFALMSVIIALWFFRIDSAVRRERVFLYIILFFIAITIALAAGFRTGEATIEPTVEKEIVEVPSKSDPYTIKLPESIHQKIERHLTERNELITSDSKIQVVENAVKDYISKNQKVSIDDSASPQVKDNTIQRQTFVVQSSESKRGVDFDFNQCSRIDERGIVVCIFAVTNKQEDTTIDIVADSLPYSSPDSRIIDSNGVAYNASNIEIGTESSSYVARVKLVKDVLVRGKLTFTEIPDNIDALSLLEINSVLSRPRGEGFFSIQFKDISLKEQ